MTFNRHTSRISKQTPWYSRGYLPRCDESEKIQSLTFRLYDSVPAEKVQQWREELNIYPGISQSGSNAAELRRRIAKYEDQGVGSCWLAKPEVAEIMQNALLHFDGERYKLLAWCVMPNHVHVMYEKMDHPLRKVAHSWKSFTAHSINSLLNRTGEFWEREGYDRFIRNDAHFQNVKHYIEQNPVEAGLAKSAVDWKFSSATFKNIV